MKMLPVLVTRCRDAIPPEAAKARISFELKKSIRYKQFRFQLLFSFTVLIHN